MKEYEITLTTVECTPAYSATVTCIARTLNDAKAEAMGLDFGDLDWQDDLGRSKAWDDIDCSESGVVIAE